MKKINIGAGRLWRSKGWETLDNGTKSLASSWQNYGKCWESKLKDKLGFLSYLWSRRGERVGMTLV